MFDSLQREPLPVSWDDSCSLPRPSFSPFSPNRVFLEDPSCYSVTEPQAFYGQSAFESCAPEVASDIGKAKRKARRKRKIENKEEWEQKQAKRAESNRKAAKESRERKKKYIESLESEVKLLREEVKYYKSKLERYELIERQRNLFGYEMYVELENTHKELYERKAELTDCELFKETLSKNFDLFMEERRKALEQLTRTMVEIITPLPWRLFFWATEHDAAELLSPEEIISTIPNELRMEDKIALKEALTMALGDKRQSAETKLFFANSSIRLKTLVRQLVECQKKIQSEIKVIGKRIYDNFIPTTNPSAAQILAQFASIVKNRPEFSDYSIYQLEDSDFGTESYYISEKLKTVKPC